MSGRARELVLALGVGVVLADSSIVTLALPEILDRFDTSVFGVSWVLTAFNIVLAALVVPAAVISRSTPRATWGAGLIVFALASAACAVAPSVAVLIAARCVQALGGAALVAGAIELLARSCGSHAAAAPAWGAASLAGLALGPAAGGLLTELLSWEAIFFVQIPLIASLALAPRLILDRPERGASGPIRIAPEVALGLLSAGLTGAIFLLVIMLTQGWGLSPLAAALVISAMPVATLTAGTLARSGRDRSWIAAGAILLAAGLAALGLLPGADVWWTVAPQVLVGAGIAFALPGLESWALATRDPTGARATTTIAARHVGVVAGIVCLTPVFSAQLGQQYADARLSGTAYLLDAELPVATKAELGDAIGAQIAAADGDLPDLEPAFAAVATSREEAGRVAELEATLSDEVDRAATNAFSLAFLLAGAFALAALIPVLLGGRPRPERR